ncbi:MAG TPA: diguanylate cyclase [Solirubrobacteraceae bacterium]|jgi:diguanylate cyclase (GGDEF)-like protein
MSFRTRLTSFFLLIVVVPMIGVGLLVFNLINQSRDGKADARANGLASAAASVYESQSAAGKTDAAAIARQVSSLRGQKLDQRVAKLAAQAGLARVTMARGTKPELDRGSHSAIAPGSATISGGAGGTVTITASEVTAAQYAHELDAPDVGVVVRQGATPVGSSFTAPPQQALPRSGAAKVNGANYRAVTQQFRGFGSQPVNVTVLSADRATASSVSTSRTLAIAFIAGFLLLACAFAVLASKALQSQLARFLHAAQRIGTGDFKIRVPTEGHDEFAALGNEFNQMADELARRIDELAGERARLRELIHRIGQTFAANLNREALLRLALQTAADAVEATGGRLSARTSPDAPLSEAARVGSLDNLEETVLEAERQTLKDGGMREIETDGRCVAAVTLGDFEDTDRPHGVITVAREGARFSADERDLLTALALQATAALENVERHDQAKQQAVTDPLTGLTNHGRFQELLSLEVEEGRRYNYPVGLVMLDVDNFKSFNDTYGHQQGDVVLKRVARVLRDNSREVDLAARYGGEEMTLILPHTDLEGSYAIAERVRVAVEAMRVPKLNGEGQLQITASLGVAVSTDWDKDVLISDADAALYQAKRDGKNRTSRAPTRPKDVVGAEEASTL